MGMDGPRRQLSSRFIGRTARGLAAPATVLTKKPDRKDSRRRSSWQRVHGDSRRSGTMSVGGQQVRVAFEVSCDSVARLYGPANATWDRIEKMFSIDLECAPSGDNRFETITIRGDRTSVEGAKDYVRALCGQPDVERRLEFPAHLQQRLQARHLDLEQSSWALVRLGAGVATIRGSAAACDSAMEILEVFIRFFRELEQQGVKDTSRYDSFPYQRIRTMLSSFENARRSAKSDETGGNKRSVESLVAYATQVGWKEEQVRLATKKLGDHVDVNTLLTYLMKHNPVGQEPPRGGPVLSSSGAVQTVGEASDSNISHELTVDVQSAGPRRIVIDGSNVAMAFSKGRYFACKALERCVEYFANRGHEKITCFVPRWRKENSKPEHPIEDQHILDELEERDILVYTPSRRVGGKRKTSYDDRFIVEMAAQDGGVIVSNDFFRDLAKEKEEWREVIEQRLLPYAWADGIFMPAPDPLGKNGPTLEEFLHFPPPASSSSSVSARKVQPVSGSTPSTSSSSNNNNSSTGSGRNSKNTVCPYGKKCTYGLTCSYRHPERDADMPEPPSISMVTQCTQDNDLVTRGSHAMPEPDMMPPPSQPQLMSFVPNKPQATGPMPPPPPAAMVQSMYGYSSQGYEHRQQHSGYRDQMYGHSGMHHSMNYDHHQDSHRGYYDQQQQQQQHHYAQGQYFMPPQGQYEYGVPAQPQQRGGYAYPQQPESQSRSGFPELPDGMYAGRQAHSIPKHPRHPDPAYSEPLPSAFPEMPAQSHFQSMPEQPYAQDSYPRHYTVCEPPHSAGQNDERYYVASMPPYASPHCPPAPAPTPAPSASSQCVDVDQMARTFCQRGLFVKEFCMVKLMQPQQQEEFVKDIIRTNGLTTPDDLTFLVKRGLDLLRRQRQP